MVVYREGRCPKCREVMQIPEGRSQIICMFCGEPFAVADTEEGDAGDYAAELELFRECADTLFCNVEKTVKGFQRNQYEGSFQSYLIAYQKELKMMQSIMYAAPERTEAEETLAEIMTDAARRAMENSGVGKLGRESLQMTMNMYMVTYVLPAILYTDAGLAGLADCICREWSSVFKKSNIQAATYDALKEGFRRKLCYITTAVCESLNKPRDCYELQVLKAYRDNYLSAAPGGEALIAQYYDLAPTIVKRVNKQKEHASIYRELYETYISPCVRLIEEGENEACREKYQEMVERLQAEYLNAVKEQKRDR